MIKILTKTLRLNSLLFFNFSKARRDPSLPTEANFLRPFSINCLQNNQGARQYAQKVGRGPGSGKGKFAGRGMKGHNARTGGGVHVRFEGGQVPITRRLPKFGRVRRSHQKQILSTVNLTQINYFVKKGILDPKSPITIKHLVDCGLAKKVKYGVKVLGKGFEKIDYPLHLQVSDASANVIRLIEEKGGSVKLIFRTQLKLKEHIWPQKYPIPLAEPLPPAWRVRKIGRLEKNRNHEVVYRKPKWKIEQQKEEQQNKGDTKKQFVYPVPRTPDPTKIHKRKVKLYRRIAYKLG